jgi:hypothetical protein
LPAESLPTPPKPLRYQRHSWQGRDFVFASALLFHQEAVHFTALPGLRFRYPQLTLRLCVLDADGTPSVLFRKMLMPAWVTAPVWLVTSQPVSWAKLHFPHPSRRGGDGPWVWRVERSGALEVRARLDSPAVGEGPRLGGWDQVVRYFEERPHGYAEATGTLQRVEAHHPEAAVWPLHAEIHGNGLLPRLFNLRPGEPWPALHSAWLCPEMPFVFDLGLVPKAPAVTVARPEPAAGRVITPVFRSANPSEVPAPERRRMAC